MELVLALPLTRILVQIKAAGPMNYAVTEYNLPVHYTQNVAFCAAVSFCKVRREAPGFTQHPPS